ncbi:MAG: hypothetical protein K940chlam7_01903 [Chlamydiae bacterium]|nr:hypothetical protein [Chlamydiota bacterium]
MLAGCTENMQSFPKQNPPQTVVLRHRKENLKKCSLKGMEKRPDFQFFTYPLEELPPFSGYVLLTLDAPPLDRSDVDCGLFILDGTWRYAEKMMRFVESHQEFIFRSIPKGWKTAYPRKQNDCPSPEEGLASIEAIFAAYHTLGRDTTGLLDHYYWKDQFLDINGICR